MLRNGRMWPLVISGLLCVPALVMLSLGWPQDAGTRMDDVTVATEVAPAALRSAITISLPPGRLLAELPQVDLVWDDSFVDAPMPPDLTPPSPKRVRILHAHAPTPRPPSSVLMAQTAFQKQPDTVWARVAHWLTQHEVPKVWSPGGGEGAG